MGNSSDSDLEYIEISWGYYTGDYTAGSKTLDASPGSVSVSATFPAQSGENAYRIRTVDSAGNFSSGKTGSVTLP